MPILNQRRNERRVVMTRATNFTAREEARDNGSDLIIEGYFLYSMRSMNFGPARPNP